MVATAAASLPTLLVAVAQGRRQSRCTGSISTRACSHYRLQSSRRRRCCCCYRYHHHNHHNHHHNHHNHHHHHRHQTLQLHKLRAVRGDVEVQQTTTVVEEADKEWRRLVHLIESGQDDEMDVEAKACAAEYAAQWKLSPAQERCVAIAVTCGQRAVLEAAASRGASCVSALMDTLVATEEFYGNIGGIAGYQAAVLQRILALLAPGTSASNGGSGDADLTTPSTDSDSDVVVYKGREFRAVQTHVLIPEGLNIEACPDQARIAALGGVLGLHEMGEIYPLGGAGDRLGHRCAETGVPLPVAALIYGGRPLLEWLVRDIQGREYLHWKLTGNTIETPIALMTSDAKENDTRVRSLLAENGYFGRSPESFFVFKQPLVPVVSADAEYGKAGAWLVDDNQLVTKPGGHGVLWKLGFDKGMFEWFLGKERRAAIIRQISNPIAGMDLTLPALSGTGLKGNRVFGFASCERTVGATEGLNVLYEDVLESDSESESDSNSEFAVDRVYRYGVSNIEYTEFSRMGLADEIGDQSEGVGAGAGSSSRPVSLYPANTNVLYVDLKRVFEKLKAEISNEKVAFPGLTLNLSKKTTLSDSRQITAGRLECTMQNIADELGDITETSLPQGERANHRGPFVVTNRRSHVTSSAKKQPLVERNPETGQIERIRLQQSPQGSFFDLLRNVSELFKRCGVSVPPMPTPIEYFENGPSFIAYFHPALGPLWDVIEQKIAGGKVETGSYVDLEIAELEWKDVSVSQGSTLKIIATQPTGRRNDSSLQQQSSQAGRCRMTNVTITNQGLDWEHPDNCFWKNEIAEKEKCEIRLIGNASADIRDVHIRGDFQMSVPDGHCLVIRPCESNNSDEDSHDDDDSCGDNGTGHSRGFTAQLRSLQDAESYECDWEWQYHHDASTGRIVLKQRTMVSV